MEDCKYVRKMLFKGPNGNEMFMQMYVSIANNCL